MKNIEPYIGVTGVENPIQVERMISVYNSEKGDLPHLLAIGGIVSYKTLIGIKDKPIVLTKNTIEEIYRKLKNLSNPNVLFALHYFTKPLKEIRPELQEKAKQVVEKSLPQQISLLIDELYRESKPSFQIGVQINIPWPKPEDITQVRAMYPKLRIILQVSEFSQLEEKIKEYGDNIDYVLIDPSRGRGIELDINEAARLYTLIDSISSAKVGFAGGFSPENVEERITSLKEKLGKNDFCIDAQTGLRSGEYLDMEKVERYLRKALRAFR